MPTSLSRVCCFALVFLAVGCSKKADQPFRKEVIPVTGKVVVDGQAPDTPVMIKFHYQGTPDTEHPTATSSETKSDGSFAASTYVTGDGIPEGDYLITFEWKPINVISGGFSGPDKLKGKYADAEKSTFKVKAEKGKPVDLGTIELATK